MLEQFFFFFVFKINVQTISAINIYRYVEGLGRFYHGDKLNNVLLCIKESYRKTGTQQVCCRLEFSTEDIFFTGMLCLKMHTDDKWHLKRYGKVNDESSLESAWCLNSRGADF